MWCLCRQLTEKPHIAGNVSDVDVAMFIYNTWKSYRNFDSVELANYTVLLQYPGNGSGVNRLELRESGGKVIYTAATRQEKPLLPQERDPSVAPPFNAYSGTGNVSVRQPPLPLSSTITTVSLSLPSFLPSSLSPSLSLSLGRDLWSMLTMVDWRTLSTSTLP